MSEMKGNYFVAQGIKYEPELRAIKKKQGGYLRPIYEAFSNSWESIIERFKVEGLDQGKIYIDFYVIKKLLDSREVGYDFDKIQVIDNGIGVKDVGLERIKQLRDNSKGSANKGTGRVQYIHSFDLTSLSTIYEENGEFKKRIIKLSKSDDFISRNSILWYSIPEPSNNHDSGCITEFTSPLILEENEALSSITPSKVKDSLLTHFICIFARHRNKMPKICVRRHVNNEIVEKEEITKEDVLEPDKSENIKISYSTFNSEGKIIRSSKKETFLLTAFVADTNRIKENALYLVGKEEIANKIKLHDLKSKDNIDGNRYLFFLSGEYLDKRDDDARGDIMLMRKKEFKERAEELPLSTVDSEQILWEDIEEYANENIGRMYSSIALKKEEQLGVLDNLQKMFLLDDDDVKRISKNVKNSDSPSKILEKIYDLEAKRNAEADAKIHCKILQLNKLNPKDKNYRLQLQQEAQELTHLLPARNKALLSRYVCRRKIVLDLLESLLKRSKDEASHIDESTLHNLFITRNSAEVMNSDMWIMNEEYLYFRGTSDISLDSATIDGKKILKDTLTKEEEDYKKRFFAEIEQDQGKRRPDVLLFPEEGKCIIVEFKAPKVDVSYHLNQISRYATLLRNLSKDEFLCDKFYGYLIGENINYDSVRDAQADYEEAPTKDCLYRVDAKVNGKFGRSKGYLYTEIIKYSDLLKRARRRNQVFTDILFEKNIE